MQIEKTATVMPECLEMLREAMAYLVEENVPRQAEIMHNQFYEAIRRIERQPSIGTKCQHGMRKTSLGKFRSYNIYYMEREDTIEVLGIHHTSRGTEFQKI